MNHHPKCYMQVDSATAWATSYGSVGSVGCRICDWIVEIEQDAIANMTAEWMSNYGDRWEFSVGQRDMLAKCIAAVEGIKSIYIPKDSTALQELNIKIINTLRALQEKI